MQLLFDVVTSLPEFWKCIHPLHFLFQLQQNLTLTNGFTQHQISTLEIAFSAHNQVIQMSFLCSFPLDMIVLALGMCSANDLRNVNSAFCNKAERHEIIEAFANTTVGFVSELRDLIWIVKRKTKTSSLQLNYDDDQIAAVNHSLVADLLQHCNTLVKLILTAIQ